MIDDNDNPRPDIPRQKWKRLEASSEPALPALANFVHGCSKDPNERTLAVTVLVASLCQLTGRKMMGRMPSTIMVNAHDLTPDPIDLLAGMLIPGPSEPLSGLCRHPNFLGGSAKDALWAMVQAINMKGKLANVTPLNAADHQAWEDRFFAAQSAGFGSGPSRGYAEAWNETFGLMSNPGNELILRIQSPEDRSIFCRDVVEGARRLREPLGYDSDLKLAPKHIALSGSLPASTWDASLATSLVELGLPLVMLPSLAKKAPEIANDAVLQFVAGCMPKHFQSPMEEPANLIQTPWFDGYGQELRKRLHHLPADYEYSIQKLARQLFPACLRIANCCGTYSSGHPEEILALTKDLCGHALRGLVLSVAGLAWHGLGIDTGCPRGEFVRVLDYLRRKGPMSRSDMHRRGHIKDTKTRDMLVELFETKGLARVDGKTVEATSYPEFVEALYSRKEFPQPVNHWARLGEEGQSAA